jgi:hypothetical protein
MWISLNTLKAELNPICYLLALLGAHHFLHVSRIRVNVLVRQIIGIVGSGIRIPFFGLNMFLIFIFLDVNGRYGGLIFSSSSSSSSIECVKGT